MARTTATGTAKASQEKTRPMSQTGGVQWSVRSLAGIMVPGRDVDAAADITCVMVVGGMVKGLMELAACRLRGCARALCR